MEPVGSTNELASTIAYRDRGDRVQRHLPPCRAPMVDSPASPGHAIYDVAPIGESFYAGRFAETLARFAAR